jgi:crotonobetainyl-CoA:carnitine CoA-transferase CaiB-like acyl-CoA transferase
MANLGAATVVSFREGNQGPLDGIRVVDLSRLVAGNMLTLQLADFGADVIKVEPPTGDPLRDWREGGKSFFWKVYGRNKRSIVLDLHQEAANQSLLAILRTADVMVENFRPGTLEKMGMAPEVLHRQNPRLIIVRISGFGQTGPYAQQPGFGTLVEAMSGFAARNGFPDREPVLPPLALADMVAGLYGAFATVTAVLARNHSGASGQVIDLSLLESFFSVLGPDAAVYRQTGKIRQRVGSGSGIASPRNVYKCGDGKYVALSGSIQSMAMRIFETIGRPDMKNDPRYATNAARVKNRHEVDEVVGAWFATKTREEALAQMELAGATVGPVYDVSDIVKDPHFLERQILLDVEDPELGAIPMHNIVPRLSGTPGAWRRPAPALGEHTRAVLAEAGYSPEAIETMIQSGGAQ